MEKIKLQKYFTDCGIMSRRAAESEILDGRVLVNGERASLGMRIDPDSDTVEYKGKILKPMGDGRVCVMLNKPTGFVTTLSDEKGRRTVAELVADVGVRVYPIGRLDMNSDGLLLLTNDGELANRLTHPRHEIPKIYRVTVGGEVTPDTLSALSSPMVIDGYKIQPVKTSVVSFDRNRGKTVLSMELYEGRNRQIRKMCELVGLRIFRLSRIAIGELTLGELPAGRWRALTADELEYLRGNKDRI